MLRKKKVRERQNVRGALRGDQVVVVVVVIVTVVVTTTTVVVGDPVTFIRVELADYHRRLIVRSVVRMLSVMPRV